MIRARSFVSLMATVSVLLGGLTGCTATPRVLTVDEAGERFLDIVCPSNNAGDAVWAEFEALWKAGSGDLQNIQELAESAKDVSQSAATAIDDPKYVWPEVVQEDMDHMAESFIVDVSAYDELATTSSYKEAMDWVLPPLTPEQEAAAPNVRTALGLSDDTFASCEGHE